MPETADYAPHPGSSSPIRSRSAPEKPSITPRVRSVAFVEVVRLELPCQYHLGYLVSEKLVIDCLPFGVRYIPSPSSMASPLLTRLPIALP